MNHRTSNKLAIGLTLALTAVYLAGPLAVHSRPEGLDTDAFGELPALFSGRCKPIDSIARNSLMSISGRQSLMRDTESLDAVTWLLDVIARPDVADHDGVFRVDHPGVRGLLGLTDPTVKRASYNLLMQKASELQAQAVLADQTPQDQRDAYQGKVLQLSNQLALYQSLRGMDAIRLVPTDSVPGEWAPIHFVSQAGGGSTRSARIADGYRQLFVAYRDRDASRFNSLTHSLRDMMRLDHRALTDRARLEAAFNRYGVFFRASVLYLVIGLMTMVCWLRWQRVLHGAAFALLVVVLGVHTLGLGMRVYLSGRPPVTNLYSSALFIGWGVAVLCVILEYLHRNTMGLVVAAAAGFTTLLIAQGLSGNGDSMAVLQAVLDTNFWLATHVTTVTLGYSATYAAGVLGLIYVALYVLPEKAVLRQRVTIGSDVHTLTYDIGKILGTLTYAVVCFATLLSFVGTVLGGIWADQSWGRFWGWDPKENGAVLIVLWNALILHARWGGLVKERGMAVLTVVGIIITTWSWFGTNQLGVGLHAYGFNNQLVRLCDGVWLASLAAVLVGVLPWQWVYRGGEPAPPPLATRV